MAKYALPADCPFSLKKFKEYPKLSQETLCFTAEIAYKGKVVGTVENRGHGGSNNVYWSLLAPLGVEAMKALEAFTGGSYNDSGTVHLWLIQPEYPMASLEMKRPTEVGRMTVTYLGPSGQW
jgi:hypothetical protein